MDEIGIGLKFKTTYEGLAEGKQDLQQLKKIIDSIDTDGVDLKVNNAGIDQAKIQMQALERSIKEAEASGGDFGQIFKANLNSIQSEALQTTTSIRSTEQSIKSLNNASKQGSNGGFSSLSTAARLATKEIQGTTGQLDQLRNNMQQGLGQSIAFGAIGLVTGGIVSALSTAKDLDKVSTDISIVSGKTRDEMEAYRDAASEAADILGTTTKKYMEASLIYEQQGGDAAYYASELAKSTVVAANVSGVATDQMSEYLTSTINGFQMLKDKGGEAGTYITDVLAKLGAASGSDLGEVATGLSRTANTAKDAKYEFEEISSAIATVSEVTRRTPQTIGTAFKTILTSFTQLRDAGKDEVDAFTTKVNDALKKGGITDIPLFDNGNLRAASDIFKDIAGEWDTMNTTQQALVSEAIAGKQQAEVLRAFFNNQERYQDLLGQAYGSSGTAAQQQLIYMDSLQAKTEALSNGWQGVVDKVVDSDMFKGVLDDLTNMLKLVSSAKTGMGGMATVMSPLVGLGGQLFGGKKVSEMYSNKALNSQSKSMLKEARDTAKAKGEGADATAREYETAAKLNQVLRTLGPEASKNYENSLNEITRLNKEIANIPTEKAAIRANAETLAHGGGVAGINTKEFSGLADAKYKDTDRYQKAQAEYLKKAKELEEQTKEYNSLKKISNKTAPTFDDLTNQSSLSEKTLSSRNKGKQSLNELKKWANSYSSVVNQNDQLQGEFGKEIEDTTRKIKELSKNSKDLNQVRNEAIELEKKVKKSYAENAENEANASLNKLKEQKAKVAEEKASLGEQGSVSKNAKADVYEVSLQKEYASRAASTEDAKKQAEILQKRIDQTDAIAKKTRRVESVVRGASLAYSTLVPVIAAYNAAQEGTLSKQDAVISSTQNVATMMMASMNPYLMAGGAVVGIIGMLVDKFDLLKTKVEKVKETNEEFIKSFVSLQEKTSGNLTSLNEITEAYNAFQGQNAQGILDSGKTEDIEKYTSMAERLVSVYPELLKYYDKNGVAVVDLSKNMKSLVEEQNSLSKENSDMMVNNSENFFLEYSSALEDSTGKMASYQKQLKKAKKELSSAQADNNEDAISEAMKKIEKANKKISEFSTTTKDAKANIQANIIEPFVQSSISIQSLSNKSQSLVKQFASDHLNSSIVTDLMGSQDEEKLSRLQSNLSLVTQEMEKMEQASEGSSSSIVENINKYSTFTQNLALGGTEEAKSYNDIVLQLERASDVTKVLYENTVSLRNAYGDIDTDNVDLDKYSGRKDASDAETVRQKTVNKEIKDINSPEIKNPDDITGYEKGVQDYYDSDDQKKEKEQAAEQEFGDVERITEAIGKQAKVQDSVTEAYRAGLDTIDGMKEAMEDLNQSSSAMNILNNTDSYKTFSDQIEDMKKTLPSLGEEMSKAWEASGKTAKDQARIIKNSLGTASSETTAIIMAADGDNQTYYKNWLDNNKEQVSKMEETFGIQASDSKTLNELKQAAKVADLKGDINLSEEKGKISKAITDNDKENKKIILDNAIKQYASELSTDQMTNIKKRADTVVTAKLKYEEIKSVTDRINALIKGKTVREKDAAYWKDYEKEIKKELQNQIKAAKVTDDAAESLGLGGNETKEDFSGGVWDSIFANSNLDTSSVNSELESKYQAAMNALNNDTSSGSNSGSGTSSGTGESEKESEVANLELTLDRYYKLENILKTIEKRYSELSDAKDAAYGKDRLKIMEQEESLLAEKAATTKQYIAALRQEQSETRATLANSGFGFDANGDISNLNEKLKAMQANANSLTGDAKESAIDAVQKMQDVAERYQEITFDLIPDKQETLNEIKKTLSDLESEKIDYKVKLVVDKEDFKNQVLDVVKEMQDSYDDLDEKAQIAGKSMASAMSMVSYWKSMIAEVSKNTKLTDADRQEKLDDYNSKLLGAVSDARAGYEDLQSAQADFVSQSIDAIDKVNDRYGNIISKASTLAEKTKDLYGPQAYGKIAEYYGVQEDAINSQIANLQESQKLLIKYRDSIEEGSEAWESANDKINEMGDAISEAILSKLDLIQQKFDNFTDSLFSSFDKMFGVDGLSGAVDDFDDLIAKQNKYFSNFDKFTTISTEIKKVNDQIAATNDPEKAKILAKYRDKELASLLEQEKITQDDYDRAQKIYDIKLKELALQERQDAKRTAQLVRDQNGNMTYEYVRTESEDVSEDLKELQEQKDSLYDFDSDKIKDAAKGVYDVISQYQSDLAALKDKGLSTEDYQEELKKMLAEAESDVKDKTDEMNKWISNAAKDGMDSLKTMVSSGTVTPDQLGVDQNTINSIFAGMDDGSLTVQDMLSGNYSDFANSLGMSSEDLAGTMDKILQLIMGDNLDIAQAMTDASNKWTSSAQSNVDELGNAYGEYMNIANGVLGDYNSSTGDLNNLLNDTNNASRQVIGTINSQTEAMLNAQKQNENTTKSVQNLQNALIGNNGASGLYGSMIQLQNTMNGELQPSYINTGAETDILSGKTYVSAQSYEAMANTAHTAYGQVNSFRDEPTKKAMGSIDQITTKTTGTANAFTDTANDAATAKRSIQDFSSVIQTLQGYGAYKVTSGPTKPVGMASGGYTGTWDHSTNNSEGRLAVLHEKELVLNSQDTENLLSAVNMQRSLMESIKGRGTSSTINTVRNIDNSIKNLQSDNSKTQTIEQQITLAPTFPNAQNRSEIEGALQGLLVKATTYVGKTTN